MRTCSAWRLAAIGNALLLAGCSGLRSDAPPTQAWRLDPPAAAAIAPVQGAAGSGAASAATLRLLRPLAAPGLDSDRIALLRPDRTLDYYAANRWSGRVPEMVQALALDTLRAAGAYRAVQPEEAPFSYDETLQIEVRDFQAEYGATGAPVARVALVCTLGRRSDRAVLATFTLAGSAAAADNRMHAIVAAFDAALDAALAGLPGQLTAASR
jgi:cholesterol transport system auxiliary component